MQGGGSGQGLGQEGLQSQVAPPIAHPPYSPGSETTRDFAATFRFLRPLGKAQETKSLTSDFGVYFLTKLYLKFKKLK